MGIYIIKSKYNNWIKIGHHKVTKRKPNAYFRYINRGFYSCSCPKEIEDKVSFNDLELIYWFPNLNIKIERELHLYLKNNNTLYLCNKGEWYNELNIDEIKNILEKQYNGVIYKLNENDLLLAQTWCKKINKNI